MRPATSHKPDVQSSRFRGMTALWLLLCIGLELSGLTQSRAETFRVTTWNVGLQPGAAQPDASLTEIAGVLRNIDPDVILLQAVPDWRTCLELAELLKPLEYQVVVCSSFRSVSTGSTPQPQVAILSKRAAYFTWTQGWPGTKTEMGGVGFAALEMGTQRLGFFAALPAAQQSGPEIAKLLLAEMDVIKAWETNNVQTFVVASSSSPLSRNPPRVIHKLASALDHAGLVDAEEKLPEEAKPTLRLVEDHEARVGDGLFVGPQGFPTQTRVQSAPESAHLPLTCEIELDPERVALALDVRAEERRERAAQVSLARRKLATWIGSGLGVMTLIAGLIRLRARKTARASAPARPALPTKIEPTNATESPLPPVILVEAQDAMEGYEKKSLPPRLKPTLKLQSREVETSPSEEAPRYPKELPKTTLKIASRDHPQLETTEPATPPPIQADAGVEQGIVQELAGWLKQKLVHRLVSDRKQMLQAQQLATHMAAKLDDRLSRIEAQIQEQNQAYIRRIEELNRELAAAREENKELIRERIAQVKAEMEAARAKVLAEANLNSTSLRL